MKSEALLFAILLASTAAAADPMQAREPRKTAAFTAIDITGTITVEARIDRVTSVEVRGDADQIKHVSTTVSNGTLVIATHRDMKPKHMHVIVTAPDLSALSVTGVGQLDATGIANARLDVRVRGTGQLTLSGKTANLRLVVAGTGGIKASQLVADTATIDIPGTAEVHVHATRTLDLNVDGTASLQIQGKPTIKKHVTGTLAINER